MYFEEGMTRLKELTYKLRYIGRYVTRPGREYSLKDLDMYLDHFGQQYVQYRSRDFKSRISFKFDPIPCIVALLMDVVGSDIRLTTSEFWDLYNKLERCKELQEYVNENTTVTNVERLYKNLSDEEIAEIILYLFNKGVREPAVYITYVNQLQGDVPKMMELLGMGENEVELLWEELINPGVLCQGDHYGSTTVPLIQIMNHFYLMKEMKENKGK